MDSESNYKAEVLNWDNGEKKLIGGYIYYTGNDQWVKIGEWKWFDETGKLVETKKYQWGVEISE